MSLYFEVGSEVSHAILGTALVIIWIPYNLNQSNFF